MKRKKPVMKPLALVASAMICCALRLPAQPAPAITTQPASQTVLAGSNATFSVAVTGTGPFNFQWQCNGTNLPAPGVIATVAGGGNAPDGYLATIAGLNYPSGVAVDSVGDLYIGDSWNDRIRKVDTNGIITTVAGGGDGGDGGAATNAALNYPTAVALDAFGNLYIADSDNNCIRCVETSGIITTVAGNGRNAPVGAYSGDGGAATNASLYGPCGVAIDPWGNLFIADQANHRIREVDTNGVIWTVAGNGNGSFSGDGGQATNAAMEGPASVALDALGDLFILDADGGRVRMVAPNGIITTVAGNGGSGSSGDGGPATNASLYYPFGLATDLVGDLLIADTYNQRIREVFSQGTALSCLPAVGSNNMATYDVVVTSPFGSRTSSVATVLVVEITSQPQSQGVLAGSNATLSVAASGYSSFSYQWCFNGDPLAGFTNSSFSITGFDPTNEGAYTVVLTTAYGSVTSQVATLALPPSLIIQPGSLTVLPGSNVTFNVTSDGVGPFVYQWRLNGACLPNTIITTVAGSGTFGFSGDGGAATNAGLDHPNSVALDAAGNLYIADSYYNHVRKVDTNGIITSMAGGGHNGLGDGGPATNASLNKPSGVAVDASGRVYIADQNNSLVRKVDTNGIITTLAGGGSGGDGGAATNASVNHPAGVASDPAGNLYIADTGNNRIRKVDTNGIITTIAGNGFGAFAGDGGAAIHASLSGPTGVAVDAVGNLYIADEGNQRVRKVSTSGVISTVTGTSSAGYFGDGGAAAIASLNNPRGVAMDAVGNLYIADSSNKRIRKVDTNGIITTVAGGGSSGDGGPATSASLNWPAGVVLDAIGDLYIADAFNYRVRKVDTNGIITTVAGSGTRGYGGDGGAPTNAGLYNPYGVAVDGAGNLYIADTYNMVIRKALIYAGYPALTLVNVGAVNAGNYTVVISNAYGSVTSAVATLIVQAPPVITVQPASQIAVIGSSPTFSVTAAGSGPFGYLWYFAGINLLQSGTNSALTLPGISPANAGSYTVVVTNSWGSVTSQVAALTVAYPPSVTAPPVSQSVMAATNLTFSVVAGGTGPFNYVWQFNGANLPTNIITTVAGCGTNGYAGDNGAATNASLSVPTGMVLDGAGNLYIADNITNNRIRKVDTNGIISTVAGNGAAAYSGDGGPATSASLNFPCGVASDAAGNLYIADSDNQRIRKVGTNGTITTVAGNGTQGYLGDGGPAAGANLNFPFGVAVDASGNLYIADTHNQRIRKVDTNGIITTIAGSSIGAFSGDGHPAAGAWLQNPYGVALDVLGNLYIADCGNNRIREVRLAGYPALTFTNVNATNAGSYTVVIASPYGSVTSAVATLTVEAPPVITVQPTNQTVLAGSSPVFSVSVAGSGPFGYLWYVASNNLVQSGTSSTLTLPCVFTNNAGSYTVVVTNAWGSVTSAVATLTVTIPNTPPQIVGGDGSFGFVASQFGFNLSGAFGQTIVVDGSTNLVDWTPLCTNTVAASPIYFCDSCWTNFPSRFYRARLQ